MLPVSTLQFILAILAWLATLVIVCAFRLIHVLGTRAIDKADGSDMGPLMLGLKSLLNVLAHCLVAPITTITSLLSAILGERARPRGGLGHTEEATTQRLREEP